MSNAERQARWRKNTGLRRIELYLSPDAVALIDDLVRARDAASRAEVIVSLIIGELLPPLLVDVHRALLKAHKTLLQAAERHYVRPQDVQRIMGPAIKQLEDYECVAGRRP